MVNYLFLIAGIIIFVFGVYSYRNNFRLGFAHDFALLSADKKTQIKYAKISSILCIVVGLFLIINELFF
jgi:hypothetical protein